MERPEYQITEENVRTLLREALRNLIEQDSYLLTHDLHERTITHKLGEYLQPLFPHWNVDCEYNRDGHDPKRANLSPMPKEEWGQGSNIFPDIIVHNRGDNDHNLLIIEAKKANQPERGIAKNDRIKIEALSKDLEYRFGAAVIFLIGEEQEKPFELFFYSGGKWN